MPIVFVLRPYQTFMLSYGDATIVGEGQQPFVLCPAPRTVGATPGMTSDLGFGGLLCRLWNWGHIQNRISRGMIGRIASQ